MGDLVGQLEIPRYPQSSVKKGNKDPNPFAQEDPIVDPYEEREPGAPLPEERDPKIKLPKEKEPPMTEDDYLDPSKNPMQVWGDKPEGLEVWM